MRRADDGEACDEALAARAGAGDAAAFAALVGRHRAALERVAARALGNRQEAEDVVQDAVLNAYRALAAGKRPEQVRAWLFAIVRNGCVDRRRAQRPTVALDDHELPVAGDTAGIVEQRASLDAILHAIAALPERQRALVVGRELEGTSYAELARAHGTTVPAVKSLLLRARRALAAARGAALVAPPVAAVLRRLPGTAWWRPGGAAGAAGTELAGTAAGGGAFAAVAAVAGKTGAVMTLAAGVMLSLPASHPGSASGDAPQRAHRGHVRTHRSSASQWSAAAATRRQAAPPAAARRVAAAPPPVAPADLRRAAQTIVTACLAGRSVPAGATAAQLREARRLVGPSEAEYGGCDEAIDAALAAAGPSR